MEIVLLLIVGFVVWHFIPQRDPTQPSPTFRTEPRAVASDPRWPTYIEEHCESPAETAFLRAMIKAFDLKPEGSSLTGGSLRLDFQVEEGRYRTDFLANRWLVIEIDGAAYHSSEEAIARDKERDEYFVSLGYSVVRIPAKVVFNSPREAVERFLSALEVGKRSLPAPARPSGWQRLSATMASISDGLDEINEQSRKSRARQRGVALAKEAFETEKIVIESAIESAKSELEEEAWLARQNVQMRAIYREQRQRISAEIAAAKSELAPNDEHDRRIDARPFPAAPLLSENAADNGEINAAYARIVEERGTFLNAKRQELRANVRLGPFIQKALQKMGCGQYWQLLRDDDQLSRRPTWGDPGTQIVKSRTFADTQ